MRVIQFHIILVTGQNFVSLISKKQNSIANHGVSEIIVITFLQASVSSSSKWITTNSTLSHSCYKD